MRAGVHKRALHHHAHLHERGVVGARVGVADDGDLRVVRRLHRHAAVGHALELARQQHPAPQEPLHGFAVHPAFFGGLVSGAVEVRTCVHTLMRAAPCSQWGRGQAEDS